MEVAKTQVDSQDRPPDDAVNESIGESATPGKNVLTMGDVPPLPDVPARLEEFKAAHWRRPGDLEAERKVFYEHLEVFMTGRGCVSFFCCPSLIVK